MIGQLKTDITGRHTFFVRTDGGVRLWIRDSLLIDAWDNKEEKVFTTSAEMFTDHGNPFRIEHRQFKPKTATSRLTGNSPDYYPLLIQLYQSIFLKKSVVRFWSGINYPGGQTIHMTPRLTKSSLYSRRSIIPIGPDIQFAMERTNKRSNYEFIRDAMQSLLFMTMKVIRTAMKKEFTARFSFDGTMQRRRLPLVHNREHFQAHRIDESFMLY